MEKYNNNFEFTVSNNSKTKEKLKSYFKSYDFEQVKDENENLLFVKKWSILNGWKFNPLNWETKIDIKLSENNKVIINHIVHSNGFLTPNAFKSLFEKFLLNLEQFVEFNIKHKPNNIQEIKLAKENFDFNQDELDILNSLVEEKFLKNENGKYSIDTKYRIGILKIEKNFAVINDLENEHKNIKLNFEDLKNLEATFY